MAGRPRSAGPCAGLAGGSPTFARRGRGETPLPSTRGSRLTGDPARGEPAFRARQVWEWAARGAAGYEEMTTLPAALRGELAEAVPFSTLELEHEAESRDGTVKALFRTHDGHPSRRC